MSPSMPAIPLRGSTVAGATSCPPILSMLLFRFSVRTRTASSRFGLRRVRRVSRRALLPRISLSRPALSSMLANRLGAGSSTVLLRRSTVSPMAGMLRPIAIGASTLMASSPTLAPVSTSSRRVTPSPLCMVLTPMPSPVRCLDPPMLSVPMSTGTIRVGARQAMFLCPKAPRPRTLLRQF